MKRYQRKYLKEYITNDYGKIYQMLKHVYDHLFTDEDLSYSEREYKEEIINLCKHIAIKK